jgi:hypothetical protein
VELDVKTMSITIVFVNSKIAGLDHSGIKADALQKRKFS